MSQRAIVLTIARNPMQYSFYYMANPYLFIISRLPCPFKTLFVLLLYDIFVLRFVTYNPYSFLPTVRANIASSSSLFYLQ